jgi:hypothetical protein
MSFTQDELQALNAILDQKTAELLSELERLSDQRTQGLRKELEQQQKRLEESIERSFAAQLLAFEQLINRRLSVSEGDPGRDPLHSPQPLPVDHADLPQTSFEAIEVQTEIPWEDLIDLLNKALNEQFTTFDTSLQARLRDLEREVSSQIQLLRKEHPMTSSTNNPEAEMQDILTNINQLERIVESMQVAMAANSTLLSHRLSHHQRLPMERAHSSGSLSPTEQEPSLERE